MHMELAQARKSESWRFKNLKCDKDGSLRISRFKFFRFGRVLNLTADF